jgi:hypothetical protein
MGLFGGYYCETANPLVVKKNSYDRKAALGTAKFIKNHMESFV